MPGKPLDGPIARGLQLFALSGMAIGQPLLDTLARGAPFLVAHRATPGDIVLLAAALLLGPPLVLAVPVALAGRLHAGFGRALFVGTVGLLAGLAVLGPLRNLSQSPALPLAIAVAAGGAFAFAVVRWPPARRFLLVLAIAPVVFAVVFLADPQVRKLLAAGHEGSGVAAAVPADAPPIVMVVFDELPTISLLDSRGGIDAGRYPAFARLASHATWYRQASGVHYHTAQALPALLTGRYPDPRRLPIAWDHPGNLFALLAGGYALEIAETLTRLRPRPERPGFLARNAGIHRDLRLVALHVLLPDALTRDLPPIDQNWKGFDAPVPEQLDRPEGAGMTPARRAELFGNRPRAFRAFVDTLSAAAPRTLSFLHVLLPHRPWEYLASGRRYAPTRDLGVRGGPWGPQEAWSVDAYHRHLMQLEHSDALLGELLDRLAAEGRYDESLVVVAADHGVGFWPGQPRRDPRASHPSDALGVPLFVKAPGQRDARVDDRNAETVDVLPTVAALVGVEVPWRIDGCSLSSPPCDRAHKTVFTKEGLRLSFPAQLDLFGEGLERKLRLFGEGSPVRVASAWGPYADLVGRSLDTLDVAPEPAGRIEVSREGIERARAAPRVFAPVRVLGRIRRPAETRSRVDVAVAVAGVVRAVSVAERSSEGLFFSAYLAEEHARRAIEVFTVEGSASAPRLRRGRLVWGQP